MIMKKATCVSSVLACLILAACLPGCNKGEKLGAVSGKVTFKGQPLTEGVVMFVNKAKGVHMTAPLDAEGRYKVVMAKGAGLPPGEYLVTVNPPVLDAPMGAGFMKVPEYPNIPHKYRNARTSGLTLTVTEEGSKLDIDMQP
ncbi:MAG: carboxypeptidase-like regulatory domain-containing protein [Planctomycetota bacterium]|nr:carboxypeptidase-like regulatory domain-containing protein [Planctomycetota bacterium]